MKEKINNLQLSSIIIIMFVSTFIEVTLYSIVKSSGVDSYLSILISLPISFIYYFLFKAIFNYKENLNLPEKIKDLFWKPIAYIINTILILCAICISGLLLFNLETFIVSQFLSDTPLYIIGLLFSIIIYYLNIKGIETISRTALVILVINSILFFTAFIGLIENIEISNFKPILEYGFTKTIPGTISILLNNISPILLINIISKSSLTNNTNSIKAIRISVYYSYFIMFLIIIATLGSLGITLCKYLQYPEYIVLKKIDLFVFFDSVENILSIQWILGLFFAISFYIYYVIKSINIKKINNKIVTSSLILLILVITNILVKSNTIFNYIIFHYFQYVGITFSIISVIIVITIWYKKKLN